MKKFYLLLFVPLFLVVGGCKDDGDNPTNQQAEWTIYDTDNSGLPDNYVRCIAIDNNNNKWIGTDVGLCMFNGTNWTVYNTSNSGLPDNDINCIAIDNNNNK